MDRSPKNWAGNVTFHVERAQRPASVEQLRELVARPGHVRMLGSAHSFNTIADTEGQLISVADLPPRVDIDRHASTVTVGAGVRYGDLSQRLHDAGYALHNLGSLPHISVAGSCATATHGSGATNVNLSAAASSVELVTADGGTVTLDSDDERFNGAVVSLGALGAVVSLTLRIEPAYEIEQHVYENLPQTVLDDRFDEIMSAAYSVSLFTRWREPVMDQVWVKHRTDQGPWTAAPQWFGARMADRPRNPVPGVSPAHCTQQLGAPGPWHERLPHFRLDFTPSSGDELQSEYFVPRRHAAEAFRVLDGVRHQLAPALQICEIRTIAADHLWLSPCYRRDMVGFHFTWVKDPAAVLPLLSLIEARLASFDVVPHWGKLFTMAPEILQSHYPRLADFRHLAHAYDPAGKFRNEFVDRHIFAE